MPTGAGKTVVAAYIMSKLNARKARALFLVHRRELAYQTANVLESMGVPNGIIMAGETPCYYAPFQVGLVFSVARRAEQLRHLDFDFVFIDEAHHMGAATWETIMKMFPDASCLGLTATPIRLDGKGLYKFFDEMVVGPSMGWLIDNKRLAPYRCFEPDYASIDAKALGIKKRMGDYMNDALDKEATKKIRAKAYEAYMRHCPGTSALFFGITVRDSQETIEIFNEHGVRAEHLDAKTDLARRQEVMEGFKKGEIRVVGNVNLFSEGFDAPGCKTVILGRPTKSLGMYLQQIGRALRYQEGKVANILDLAYNNREHGLPSQHREWGLDYDQEKVVASSKAGYVRLVSCAGCLSLVPATKTLCPFCGHDLSINYRQNKKLGLEEVNVGMIEVDQDKRHHVDGDIKQGKKPTDNKLNRKLWVNGSMMWRSGSIRTLDHMEKYLKDNGHRNARGMAVAITTRNKGEWKK